MMMVMTMMIDVTNRGMKGTAKSNEGKNYELRAVNEVRCLLFCMGAGNSRRKC